MPTASMISSSVNARYARGLTSAVDIELHFAALRDAVALPLCAQRHLRNSLHFEILLVRQRRGHTPLNHLHRAEAGLDVRLLPLVRSTGRRLNFRHAICEHATHAILLFAERTRVHAILNRAAERERSNDEDRQADQ